METVDLTDLVESLRKSFVKWGTDFVFGAESAIAGMEWVRTPGIELLDRAIISAVLNSLSESAILQAFFFETAARKQEQAQDYISALSAKQALPPNAAPMEFEDAEKREMAAFRDLVCLTR